MAQVAPIIDFKTEYIGSVSGDNVRCMHGENECHGNMYQLCARKLDTSKQFNWYNMIQCQSTPPAIRRGGRG